MGIAVVPEAPIIQTVPSSVKVVEVLAPVENLAVLPPIQNKPVPTPELPLVQIPEQLPINPAPVEEIARNEESSPVIAVPLPEKLPPVVAIPLPERVDDPIPVVANPVIIPEEKPVELIPVLEQQPALPILPVAQAVLEALAPKSEIPASENNASVVMQIPEIDPEFSAQIPQLPSQESAVAEQSRLETPVLPAVAPEVLLSEQSPVEPLVATPVDEALEGRQESPAPAEEPIVVSEPEKPRLEAPIEALPAVPEAAIPEVTPAPSEEKALAVESVPAQPVAIQVPTEAAVEAQPQEQARQESPAQAPMVESAPSAPVEQPAAVEAPSAPVQEIPVENPIQPVVQVQEIVGIIKEDLPKAELVEPLLIPVAQPNSGASLTPEIAQDLAAALPVSSPMVILPVVAVEAPINPPVEQPQPSVAVVMPAAADSNRLENPTNILSNEIPSLPAVEPAMVQDEKVLIAKTVTAELTPLNTLTNSSTDAPVKYSRAPTSKRSRPTRKSSRDPTAKRTRGTRFRPKSSRRTKGTTTTVEPIDVEMETTLAP